MLSYEIELDDLDHIIVSIITRNSGTTAYQVHYSIENELNEDIDPAIILSRIERLLSFNILYNRTEIIGKYTSRRFFYKGKHEAFLGNQGVESMMCASLYGF